jgi:chromosome segregation ATPase
MINPIRFIGFAALLGLFVVAPVGAEESPSSTTAAAKKLASWFSDFLKPFGEIGTTAEKQYFIDSLIDLNRDLFDLEQEKRYVSIALKRKELNRAELRRTADSLKEKIKRLRETIKKVAPQLRIAYRKGGDEAVDLLSNALATRSAFVFSLSNIHSSEIRHQIEESEAAVRALSSAQSALADAIVTLQGKSE